MPTKETVKYLKSGMPKQKTYKVNCKLDGFQAQELFDLFNHEVMQNTCLLKMEVMCGGKAIGYLEHGYGHAEWLCKLYDKLRPCPRKLKFECMKRRIRLGVWPEMTVTDIDRDNGFDKKFPRLFKRTV